MKNISEMEWNSFVCFTVDKENGRQPAKQQRKGKNRRRRKLLLCFLSELLCVHLSLSLYWTTFISKPAILLKFTHFQLCTENKQLRLLIVLGLPHILTVIYVFNKRFYQKADTSFSLSFCGKCVAANFSIFERFKIKRPPKWWMSQYVYNKHNTTWKVLAYGINALVVFVSEILLVRCAHSFDFWYVNNSCVNTVRQHFPCGIVLIIYILRHSSFWRPLYFKSFKNAKRSEEHTSELQSPT